ncbi:MAG: type II and III secretion system protein, partial [Candidatus Omnitrophica bacterium]|nr:type II and III secretion system protein [Candidatus Omnitrophota bacterium]
IAASGAKRPTTLPFETQNIGTGRNYLPNAKVPSELQRTSTNTFDDAGNLINTTTQEQLYHSLQPGFPEVSAEQFIFGTLDFSTFQMVMEFLKSRAETKILSNPRITTLNNQEAKMMVGKIVPIPTYSYSKETGNQVISGYQDMSVGVKLVVTPYINEHSYITLNVNPSVDDIIGVTGPNGERPVISTRSAETKVMIKDGQTLVIGGLISENRINARKAIPFLGEIPILNLIFGKKEGTINRTELLIFITPHIIKEADFTASEELMKSVDKTKKGAPSKNKKQK